MERIYIKEKRMRNTLKWYASALKFYRLILVAQHGYGLEAVT